MGTGAERAYAWSRVVITVVLGALPLLWIGDVCFTVDEPVLIEKALSANAAGRLEVIGLEGSRGYPYGPLPTWIYQALLGVTHDLVWVAALRSALSSAVIVASLLWLARSLTLPPAFAWLVLLSPYLWFYGRILWDNPMLLPLSSLVLASTIAFLKEPRTWKLVLTAGCLLAMSLIHLMSVAIVVPVALYLLLTEGRAVLRAWLPLGALLAITLLAVWPYLEIVAARQVAPGSSPRFRWESVGFAWQAARFISATGLEYHFHDIWPDRFLFRGASGFVLLTGVVAHGLFGLGVFVATRTIVRGKHSPGLELRRRAAVLLLSIVFGQMAVNMVTATFNHPHYYNATWIAGAVLVWLGAESLWRYRAARAVFVGHALVLGAATLGIAWHMRKHGGDQRTYGPTLSNQVAVGREVAALRPNEVLLKGSYFELRPRGPRAAMRLAGYDGSGPGPRVVVQPLSNDPDNGRIGVAIERPVSGVKPLLP
jgi:4-amino-4-deoxy-L-arabinose transferase-like glycosyltransferase